jgi:hypothetical protein
MFPDSDAAKGAKAAAPMLTADQITVMQIMKGLHL